MMSEIMAKAVAEKAGGAPEQPRRVEGYALWTLEAVTPVSAHSAVYRFASNDRKRGTPYVRGRGRTMWDLFPDHPAAAIAARLGFRPSRQLLRMVRGKALPTPPDVYAIAGFEWG